MREESDQKSSRKMGKKHEQTIYKKTKVVNKHKNIFNFTHNKRNAI